MSALAAWMVFSPTSQALRTLPETYRLNVGESYALNVGAAVLSSTDERLNLNNNTLTAKEEGESEVSVNLFGLGSRDYFVDNALTSAGINLVRIKTPIKKISLQDIYTSTGSQ